MSIAEHYQLLEQGYKEQISLARDAVALYDSLISMAQGETKAKCIRLRSEMQYGLERLIQSLNNLK